MKIFVTGTAGFIGFHLVLKLLDRGDEIVGFDSINDYYDVDLKYDRLVETGIKRQDVVEGLEVRSSKYPQYSFIKGNLEDKVLLDKIFAQHKFDAVVNLAAQAGVRHSLEKPMVYINSNIVGFTNILEVCRHNKVGHLVYASSSSVYGLNKDMPFSEHNSVNHPISLYAATKKSNELMAHVYSHLFGVPTTGLRFFTVYGPWGRPDMALYIFLNKILQGEKIDVFNRGDMERDFTYVDDIVEGIIRVIDNPAKQNPNWDPTQPDPATSSAPYRVYNIGNNNPVKLMDYIKAIEEHAGKKAMLNFLPMQPGDVSRTYANVDDLMTQMHFKPETKITEGVARCVEWYLQYHSTRNPQP